MMRTIYATSCVVCVISAAIVGVLMCMIGQFGYNMDDVVLLSDDQSNPRAIPTRENIVCVLITLFYCRLTIMQLSAMQWLVRDAQPNDSLFFHCQSSCPLIGSSS
jgi:metacaspase-1